MNPSAHRPPQIARANGIDLCYEIFGDPAAEPMILIMGLGACVAENLVTDVDAVGAGCLRRLMG